MIGLAGGLPTSGRRACGHGAGLGGSSGVAGFDDGPSEGSTIVYPRPVFRRPSVLTAPEGHRTVNRATSSEAPTPIKSRGSFDDSMLDPPLSWRWMVRPTTATS